MNYKVLNNRGFSFLEVVIASAVFLSLVFGITVLTRFLSVGMVEMQNTIQAEIFAKNSAEITKTLLLSESDADFIAHKSALVLSSNTPKSLDLKLIWDDVLGKYVLEAGDNLHEAINLYSELDDSRVKFYRNISLIEKESWGLYEVEASVCFEECEQEVKSYILLNR